MQRMNYGDLDLNLLLVLDRLLARQSVTLAAHDLGLSQPATSRALQRLRDTLGDPLFVRAGRELVPTDRARGLVEPVAAAIEAHRAVFAPPPRFDPGTATGTFTLGLGDESQEAFLQPIFRRLRQLAPDVDLRVRTLSATSVDEARRGLLDLALAPDLSSLPVIAGAPDLDEFVHRALYARRFVVAADPDHWPHPLTLAEYVAAEHAIVSFEGGGRGFIDDLLAQRGQSRRVAASVTSFRAVASLIQGTRLLAILPGELIARHAHLVAHPAPLPLPDLPMLLLWHPRQTTQGRHRFLRETVAQVVTEAVAGLPERAGCPTTQAPSPG